MIKQFRIAFGLKLGSSILTFRARHVPNAPEGCLDARWRDWPLTILSTNFSRMCQKMPKYFFEIDVGGVRMDSYGSVWTRIGPYGPWGLPGGFLGPPGALGGPQRGVKGGSPPGGARGPSWEACLLAYVGSSLIWPYGLLMVYQGPLVHQRLRFLGNRGALVYQGTLHIIP